MRYSDPTIWMARTMALAGSNISALQAQLSKIPLLTRDEELDLAALIQRGFASQSYLEQLSEEYGSFESVPSYIDTENSIRGVLAGSEARLRLVFHNLRFAFWAAGVSCGWFKLTKGIREVKPILRDHDMWGGRQIESLRTFAFDQLPIEDRFQVAVLNLWLSANSYTPNMSAKFVTYAGKGVYNALRRAILQERYFDGLGPGEAESMFRTMGALERLRRQTGREPTLEMLAADTDQGTKAVTYRIEEAMAMPRSLDELVEELSFIDYASGEVYRSGDLIGDDGTYDVENYTFTADLFEDIESVLESLSEREAGVIKLRFGLIGDGPKTLEEISIVYGTTRERVRQHESKALSHLRHPVRADRLRPYLLTAINDEKERKKAPPLRPSVEMVAARQRWLDQLRVQRVPEKIILQRLEEARKLNTEILERS